MDLNKAINERHSVREFKETKKPKYRDIIKAIEAAGKAPLAGNLPGIKFILVDDKNKIAELAEAAQQSFIAKTNYVVVMCSDKSYLEKYYYDRAEKYGKQQAGAAIENFLLKITDLGLATCWIGAFSDETVKRILKVPDNIEVEAFFPIGYETDSHKKIKPRRKQELVNKIFFNKYGNRTMKPLRSPEYQ